MVLVSLVPGQAFHPHLTLPLGSRVGRVGAMDKERNTRILLEIRIHDRRTSRSGVSRSRRCLTLILACFCKLCAVLNVGPPKILISNMAPLKSSRHPLG